LGHAFDHVLSTDAARTYKPSPRAYRLGVDALRMERQDVLFVAFAGWDAIGARRFGHPSYWMNRSQAPAEAWEPGPVGSGKDMADLLAFLGVPSAS